MPRTVEAGSNSYEHRQGNFFSLLMAQAALERRKNSLITDIFAMPLQDKTSFRIAYNPPPLSRISLKAEVVRLVQRHIVPGSAQPIAFSYRDWALVTTHEETWQSEYFFTRKGTKILNALVELEPEQLELLATAESTSPYSSLSRQEKNRLKHQPTLGIRLNFTVEEMDVSQSNQHDKGKPKLAETKYLPPTRRIYTVPLFNNTFTPDELVIY